MIDLRSDTVTQPTEEMRAAMANAVVGDDVYEEDSTVNLLQELAAYQLGKEAALFVPSGTMGNLAAILTHCRRGDEVIMGDQAHTYVYEVAGMSALGGVMPHTVPNQSDGTLKLDDIRSAIRGKDVHFPDTRLIVLENTQNRCGGVVISPEYMEAVGNIAREHNLKLHVDGARIFNAAVKLGVTPETLVKEADSVTFCLSKGLCAPVGSVLCGSAELIKEARRIRKQLGGGMRQAGILAAAGIYALENMVDRLAEDHARALKLANGLATIPGITLRPGSPHTNMIFIELDAVIEKPLHQIQAELKANRVLVGGSGLYGFRLVTHYWITDQDVDEAIHMFEKVLSSEVV
ncbi:MAG: low-specificity L-threonine aldolase [Chloroflexi bacterium HGW-Chloroflexi-10]|nr:MAG: low-specificity L-threonine aldolase [Chloroflexi bacterium HGW-Chloroflexi-10]